MWGTSLRSPPRYRGPLYSRPFVLLPSGSPTRKSLTAYVHRTALWRKSDQLLVCYGPPKKGFPAAKQTLSRWIVDAIIVAYESSDLPSPFGGQGSLNQRYGGLQGLFRRCPYSGHLWRCWVVYAPNLRQILWPRSASHSWLCCSLAVTVHSTHWAGIGNSGGVDISFP